MLLAPSFQLFGGRALQVEVPWERAGSGEHTLRGCGVCVRFFALLSLTAQELGGMLVGYTEVMQRMF